MGTNQDWYRVGLAPLRRVAFTFTSTNTLDAFKVQLHDSNGLVSEQVVAGGTAQLFAKTCTGALGCSVYLAVIPVFSSTGAYVLDVDLEPSLLSP